MNHEELKILISSYADGEVSAAEKDIVEQHLANCQECRKDLAAYQKLSSSLKQWPDERLSPDVEMNIARKSATKGRHMEHRESIQWSAILTVLAVLAVSLFGVQQYAKWGVMGRMKSTTDDIGDQFSAHQQLAYHAPAVAPAESAGRIAGGKEDRMLLAKAESPVFKDKSSTLSGSQYEPYYLASDYKKVRENNKPVQLASAVAMDAVAPAAQRQAIGSVKAVAESSATNLPLKMGEFGSISGGVRGRVGYQEATYPTSIPVQGYERDEEGLMYAPAPQPYPYHYYPQPANTESYDQINENEFLTPSQNPLSTFSIDVDTASYSNVRRFLTQGQLPPQDAVRIEELVNYFSYDYPEPMWGQPFSITTEVAPCPWNPAHQLALIGLQGKRLNGFQMPASNLVFLIDVSGSMNQPNKLPLLQDAFRMLTQELEAKDKVSIVVYAGNAGLVLDATPGNYKERILEAINRLQAGGSTAGGAGIQLAYQVARNNLISNGNNRVILATDGDFNVGISNDDELVRMIEDYRNQGIYLTVLGFGMGNYKDSKMEKLADKGNGNYFYIDNQNEARKVLVHELGSTLFTIAKDVKVQVEFNPATVAEYRLVGYENRMLAKEDFNDDTKDAGELGAGHTVTALYEIVPTESFERNSGRVDPLIYQKEARIPRISWGKSTDVMTVKLRYKDPDSMTSKLIKKTVGRSDVEAYGKSDNFRFASSVAEFGLLLRNSPYRASASFDHVLAQARSAKPDEYGYRYEFIDLVEKARALSPYMQPLPVDDIRPYEPVYENTNHSKSQK
jgi:Ca-activated chloride channel family protein